MAFVVTRIEPLFFPQVVGVAMIDDMVGFGITVTIMWFEVTEPQALVLVIK